MLATGQIKYMKIIICDNCGEKGNEQYYGSLCDKCMGEWRKESEKINAMKKVLDDELKRKFRISNPL